MLTRFRSTFLFFILITVLSVDVSAQTPPTLSAAGNQAYCPQTSIAVVTDFELISGSTPVEYVFIQISEGYENGKDFLKLEGIHPNISHSFNALEGKLKLEWNKSASTPNDTDFINAVKDVFFNSTSANPVNNKSFSITVGEANYLPSTGHYYQYISAPLITWTAAKNTAANLPKYYGVLTPYLATITSKEEAQLCGEQAKGQGWIGGSDEETEGVWKWVTGPEAGGTFWFGLANGNSNNADYPYTNWANNEPNDWPNPGIPKEENYAHVYEDGKWNDYPNYNSNIKGYIVEYGGMPGDPILNVSASTKIYIPYIESSTENFHCGPGTVTLSATASSGEVIWFDSATSTIPLYTGETYTTTSISSTKTYYVIASENGCTTGKRTPVTATIRTIPTITTVSDPTKICGAGSATLTATASAGVINWYDSLTGGISLGTGTSYSPFVSTTTTYYVDATENGCTTITRTPVIINVQYTNPPTGPTTQSFCDIDKATIASLAITGTSILWYETTIGGTSLNEGQILMNNTTYYASQTLNGCESPTRAAINVLVFETVVPLSPSNIPNIGACDTTISGDDTDGFTFFDLTENETILLNGKNASDFTFSYFTDEFYAPGSLISTPTNFENTTQNTQPIYVRISNNLNTNCFTDLSFEIKVKSLPIIESTVALKNCDEDGNPDGYTDFNLTEANSYITNDSTDTISYFLTFTDADSGIATPLNPSPFNNQDAINNEVFARIENTFGCHRVSTVALEVSVTSFPPGFNYSIEKCENDQVNDGYEIFDLTEATNYFLSQLPPQNLSIHYFRNLTDAQLSENEILPQDNYRNEKTPNQTLFVRVQSEDDGGCYDIGPNLTLNVNLRPVFEIEAIPNEVFCLNLPPTTLVPYNEKGSYTYEWFNEKNESLGVQPTITISSGGMYSAIATSSLNCESFKQSITISESNIATISLDDVSITDDSENNTITINTTNLGIGEYEYALGDQNFQSEPVFENVEAGIHKIYVNDINGCGTTPPLQVSVIGYPKFFSPNNDGTNDYWQVAGVNSNFYPTALIYIFNRFGKLILQLNPNSRGWDGSYNGEILPSDDYWFTTQLTDINGITREKKGHFSLIR